MNDLKMFLMGFLAVSITAWLVISVVHLLIASDDLFEDIWKYIARMFAVFAVILFVILSWMDMTVRISFSIIERTVQ